MHGKLELKFKYRQSVSACNGADGWRRWLAAGGRRTAFFFFLSYVNITTKVANFMKVQCEDKEFVDVQSPEKKRAFNTNKK